jgi:hypothetical protein
MLIPIRAGPSTMQISLLKKNQSRRAEFFDSVKKLLARYHSLEMAAWWLMAQVTPISALGSDIVAARVRIGSRAAVVERLMVRPVCPSF